MRRLTRFGLLLSCIIASFAMGPTAVRAATSVAKVDIDGTGGLNGFEDTATFVFQPGSLTVAALGNVSIPTLPGTSKSVKIRTQAVLEGTLDSSSAVIATPGLNTSYQWTMYGEFNALATIPVAGVVQYDVDPLGPAMTFELWYHPAVVANNLTGARFRGSLVDGDILALSGLITAAPGGFFKIAGPAGGSLLDSFGPDGWGGKKTISLIGGGNIDVTPLYTNSNFFSDTPALLQLLYTANLAAPFNQVDPSKAFDGYIPLITGVNGESPDLIAQSHGSAAVVPEDQRGAVPEPHTAAMGAMGLSVLALPLLGRRARRRVHSQGATTLSPA